MSGVRDGGGTEFPRVLETLRTRIADGTYALATHLPSRRALAEEFGVSRDIVQRVLRELNNEGWIKSRQGSGSRVVKSPTHPGGPRREMPRVRATLGPFMARVFAQSAVRLDVFTLTAECLDAHIRLQCERIRLGEITPERIELRVLLPSESLDLPYPRAKKSSEDQPAQPEPDASGRLRDRLRVITWRHTTSLRAAVHDLQTEGLVPCVYVEIRHVPLAPAFKLYLRPGVEALFGPYEVVERTFLFDDATEVDVTDVLGLGATLTRHVYDEGDPDSSGSAFTESMQAWFESCWHLLAE
ncbi:GntR family transcriptional regulator [Streptomyces sp. NBC_01483]|uniref:GntR family transcriptional regulator n=1 Tax=Streptomyces sp. NBC_01483 TaxID=2903883 RepID=UPI002E35231E|nr:GntR family transcriptional regulator [Streptomyces sp. NBC_01483]